MNTLTFRSPCKVGLVIHGHCIVLHDTGVKVNITSRNSSGLYNCTISSRKYTYSASCGLLRSDRNNFPTRSFLLSSDNVFSIICIISNSLDSVLSLQRILHQNPTRSNKISNHWVLSYAFHQPQTPH